MPMRVHLVSGFLYLFVKSIITKFVIEFTNKYKKMETA